ncbi:MAG: tetratricopeptide repeat-containing protein [Burkholderiales bacterium]|nr:tetratricopeptide repeat-containing protein [Burkholderiales bacterium]
MGEYARALPLLQRSLAIREKALGPEHPAVAQSLNDLAGLYRAMGEYARALPLYERSLAILEKALGAEHPDVATSLNNLAELYGVMGENAKAQPLFERSLAIASRAGVAGDDLACAVGSAGWCLARQGRPELAIFFGKQAVNTIQGLRGRLTELERELQRSFLREKEQVYRGLAELLIEAGRLPEAQQVLAMLKEEEFFDFSGAMRGPIRGRRRARSPSRKKRGGGATRR